MKARSILRAAPLIAALLLAACAGHPVRCDSHLTPINQPAPGAAATRAPQRPR